jgi:anaerobic magnesium-protoporphyrin IX monomethyl ester cyclase
MNTIDCLFIGHNEIDMSKQRQILRLSYGEDSHMYRETNMSNLGYIKYQGQLLSSSQAFNRINAEERIADSSYDDIGISETFSLAIAYLGTYLHKNGFSIDFVNSFNREKEYLSQVLQNSNVRTVIIPTTYYVFPSPIIEIISFVRRHNDTARIILGGPYIANRVRSLDEEGLQKMFKTLGADVYINNSEGEYALSRVVDAIKNDLPFDNIKNIYYKSRQGYVYTGFEYENNTLESNLVDWSLFADRIGKFVNIRTSQSCPFSCEFCNYPIYAGKYRQTSIEAIEMEMKGVQSVGKVTGMWIIDDTFNFPAPRFKEILRMMLKNGFDFKWHSFFRCQYVDEETVRLMKESGCDHVLLGIESGSQTILDNMNKKAMVKQYRAGLELLNKYGIASTASLIIGFPGETEETYMETYRFIEEAQPTFFRSHMWYYDQGAPIERFKEKYILCGDGLDWSHSTMDSDRAHELNDRLFMEIKNSVYETECPIPFHLLNRGISIEKTKKYLECFNNCVKEKLGLPEEAETSKEMFDSMREALLAP